MINLDQVRTLEWKVKQAVQLIVHLRKENDGLRGRLSDAELRLQELGTQLEAFQVTQVEMESGIRSALEQLDHLDEGSAPVPMSAVEVAPVSYPPVAPAVVVPEPVSVPEPAVEAVVAVEVPMEPVVESEPVIDGDASFDEEFARLEAEEAARVAAESAPIPESVELEQASEEGGSIDETSLLFDSPEPEPEPEEREPEQPGLGIF